VRENAGGELCRTVSGRTEKRDLVFAAQEFRVENAEIAWTAGKWLGGPIPVGQSRRIV